MVATYALMVSEDGNDLRRSLQGNSHNKETPSVEPVDGTFNNVINAFPELGEHDGPGRDLPPNPS